MGEAFLVGGNSGMSNAGAVKSRQELLVPSQSPSNNDSDFNCPYVDYTIGAVNVDKVIIIVSTPRSSGSSNTFQPCARILNSTTIRVYVASSLYTQYVQIIEFY